MPASSPVGPGSPWAFTRGRLSDRRQVGCSQKIVPAAASERVAAHRVATLGRSVVKDCGSCREQFRLAVSSSVAVGPSRQLRAQDTARLEQTSSPVLPAPVAANNAASELAGQ